MLKREIELQVREALIKLEVARGEIEISNQQVEVAREAVLHHRRRHDEGVGGLADVLEAQASLARANDNRAAALYAWNEGRIELMEAMGTIRSLGR
jgi:outer membrane protein TolC